MFALFKNTRFIRYFFSMIVLFGCQAESKYSLIQEQPICNPPCWENITPGITTKSDTLTILSAINAIQQPISDHQRSLPARFESVLRFFLSDDNKQGGEIYIQSGKVTVMALYINEGLSLRRATEIFGEPDSVLVYRGGEYVGVSFVTPQKGVAYGYTSWGQKR